MPCQDVYKQIDDCNLNMQFLDCLSLMLIESATIFGLASPSELELTLCRSELKMAKVTFFLRKFL